MTLSSRTWNRLSRRDVTVKTIEQRSRRMIRLVTVGIALATAGLVGPGATLADDATFDPPTQNERSIMMIESEEPAAFVPLTQNQRSILLIESEEPSSVTAATAFVPPTANERSIATIESKEAPAVAVSQAAP